MTQASLYPSSIEIKRLIAAVEKAGVEIGTIEIEPARVRIYAATANPGPVEKRNRVDEWFERQEKIKRLSK
ncbi:MAG: hypothetical protein MEP44_05335 [Blastomonas sp.]|nr:hypothetical protein [Blastomonas sp.]